MADQKFKSKVKLQGGANLPAESTDKALITDSVGDIKSSSVTSTELGYLSGTTSSVQGQITAAQSAADAAQADIDAHIADTSDAHDASAISSVPSGNLAATDVQGALDELQSDIDTRTKEVDFQAHLEDPSDAHDASAISVNPVGNLLSSDVQSALSEHQSDIDDLYATIASLPDPMEYKGTWNASTNSPTLTDGSGNNGDVYQVTVAGTQFSPAISFEVGDKVVYNGATAKYEKWDMTDAVSSVNGQTGAVVLTTSNISEGSNLYFTDERAQDAVGTILTDSNTIDFTYNDGTPSIVADVKTQMSITSDVSGLKLVGDSSSPGNTKYYGTDGSGTKGFFSIPATGVSAGDISEQSFSLANNQSSPADVTGLAFAAGVVRGFKALVTVQVDATLDLYETFELVGINKAGSFDMAVSAVGDESGVVFTITSAGQVQYTSANFSGFVSATAKFRAYTTTV